MTRTRLATLAALMLAALMLAGCGGSGGGEPTVTQEIHDELQAELDAALAELMEEREARDVEATGRMTAEADVERLTGELATATASATMLTGQLTAAQAEVTRLTNEIGNASDAESLRGQLATAQAEVTRLEGDLEAANNTVATLSDRIGSVDDPDSLVGTLTAAQIRVNELTGELTTANNQVTDVTGERDTAQSRVAELEGELETAQGEVTRLTGLVGTMADAADADGSLHAQLNAEKAKVTDLTTRLATANSRVTELTDEIGSTGDADSLRGQLDAANTKVNRLTAELEAANTSLNSLRGQLTTAQQQAEQARREVQEVQEQASTAETNRLSEALLGVLGGKYAASGTPTLTSASTPVDILPPSRGTSAIRVVKDGGYTVSSFSPVPPGYTGKTLTRTSVGKETIVVITDREPSRKVLDHHFLQREGGTDLARRGNARLIATEDLFGSLDLTADITEIKISHGFRESYKPPTSDSSRRPTAKRATTYSGQVFPGPSASGAIRYNVSGRFECDPVPGCRVQLTPSYATSLDSDGNAALESVLLEVKDKDGEDITGTSVLYFRPTSGAIPLDGSVDGTDDKYMAFGYWLTEPSTATGPYTYQVFGNAVTTGTSIMLPGVGASFSGTAVGIYVEQGGTATDLSKRQGQFTAAVNLSVKTSNDSTGLSGEIGTFKTTPMGGSSASTAAQNWRVNLATAAVGETGMTTIMGIPGSAGSQGGWRYSLVDNHDNADMNDDPSAAVGVFDTRIPDLLHLSGAFGAKRD